MKTITGKSKIAVFADLHTHPALDDYTLEDDLAIQRTVDGKNATKRNVVSYSIDVREYIIKHSPAKSSFSGPVSNSEIMKISPASVYNNKVSLVRDAIKTTK
ncbi:hypothetical protein [Aureispira anguillae]|nr:hypothetical protein [Aureispira anguillae]